ncbi:hypothetical protein OBK19_09410 [Empedobacter falsenii]|uniref:Uncharacterized protein n=1 Tax=Empedobacter falsenii TaxID=343874 RepID=A0ABY8VDA6_9FLAO|nr:MULTISPECIES: hypothetical protein [Empedobacter]MDM1543267.1 hypothetical protein [Empedobacter sp. 189-2]WIH98229.1 hypothetical protein OBA43_04680 [Empedobacter falsenii]
MDTYKIKELELIRTKLQFQKYNLISKRQFTDARLCHLKLKKLEDLIHHERDFLWKYVLDEIVSNDTIDSLIDIFKYFDQLNYKSRLFEKISNQIEIINQELDQYITNDKLDDVQLKLFEINQLKTIIVKKELL